jgi:hypothetical protein
VCCVADVDETFFLRNYRLASLNVSFSFRALNCLCGSIFFLTHWCCVGSCFNASLPILAPPPVTILIFLPSSLTSAKIQWTFWLFLFLFSWIFPKSVGTSSVSWSMCDNTYMSLVEVETPLHNFLVIRSCGTLLDPYLIQILLYLILHLCIHLDILTVHCTEVPGYTT